MCEYLRLSTFFTTRCDCIEVLSGHTQDVKSVLWHPDEETMVSTSYDDTAKVGVFVWWATCSRPSRN